MRYNRDEWSRRTLIPFYKNTDDMQNYGNYKEINVGKVYYRDYILATMIDEVILKEQKGLHMVFIDLEKTYDKAEGEVLSIL
ncbi:hypothetical protein Lal_00028526 [Lupinus albus]|nr:hypothetical protein Lal_00028526 [Lupinus albus]